MRLFLVLFFGLTMTNVARTQTETPAEIIFINGDIYTGERSHTGGYNNNAFWDSFPMKRVQALAVSNSKIIASGSNRGVSFQFKGPKTQVIDLGGHFVMPGFNDAHVHLGSG
jgi:predicted amidohydrolase YtcJ